jgi:hypothetical protein
MRKSIEKRLNQHLVESSVIGRGLVRILAESTDLIGIELRGKIELELAKFGILNGFGDSFSYDGEAVLIVGNGGQGKTSLKNHFLIAEDARRELAENRVTLYKSPARMLPYIFPKYVCAFEALIDSEHEPVSVDTVLHLIDPEEAGLDLSHGDGQIRLGDRETMADTLQNFVPSEESRKAILEIFNHCRVYDVIFQYGYGEDSSVFDRTMVAVDNLLKHRDDIKLPYDF